MTGSRRTDEDPAGAQQAEAVRRLATGVALRLARGRRGWSVEEAARKAGIGHMTWRRVEDGYGVRTKTYAQLDALFGLAAGSVSRAAVDDDQVVEIARTLNLDTSAVAAGRQSSSEFVRSLAGLAAVGSPVARAKLGEVAASAPEPEPKSPFAEGARLGWLVRAALNGYRPTFDDCRDAVDTVFKVLLLGAEGDPVLEEAGTRLWAVRQFMDDAAAARRS